MPKVTIEFNGDFELKEINNESEIRNGVGESIYHLAGRKEYEVILPQNAKVKVHIEESDVYKEKTIECATLKIDSQIVTDKFVKNLFVLLEKELKRIRFK
jgi:hypothetical protein